RRRRQSDLDTLPQGQQPDRRVTRQEGRRPSIYSTMDAVPNLEFYANATATGRLRRSRPSLETLRKVFDLSAIHEQNEENSAGGKVKQPVRFGWITGVMVRCMLNIWGVILFLRLSWITSQAGIILTWVIIFMSVLVTSVTCLSVSAISTNGKVSSGNYPPSFFLILIANIILSWWIHQRRAHYWRTITVTSLLLISLAGMEWESKVNASDTLLSCAHGHFRKLFCGHVIPATPEEQMISFSADIFVENLFPDWRGAEGNFFQMFAIFFPRLWPSWQTAIPKGTLMAIFGTTMTSFFLFPLSGACVLRDASGNLNDTCKLGWNFTKCEQSQTCPFGMSNSFQVLSLVSAFGPLILPVVFGKASLSSALAFLVSAPKVFQVKRQIYPYIGFFGKGYGKEQEPLRPTPLLPSLALAFILIGDCFHASITNSPGWRPSFKYYSKWTALFGSVISVVLMFLLTWWAALITFGIIHLSFRLRNVNWGSSVQAGTYNMALSYSVSLAGVEDHVKNSGKAKSIESTETGNVSLMICGDILMDDDESGISQRNTDKLVKWLNCRKHYPLTTLATSPSEGSIIALLERLAANVNAPAFSAGENQESKLTVNKLEALYSPQ
uniref:Solute carrier family 12 member 10, tandem duplicate 1 n=1 Tax=Astyanax mexicanus TaxID=7994 RepID=A0A3B1K722_ASTMX